MTVLIMFDGLSTDLVISPAAIYEKAACVFSHYGSIPGRVLPASGTGEAGRTKQAWRRLGLPRNPECTSEVQSKLIGLQAAQGCTAEAFCIRHTAAKEAYKEKPNLN